jgi:hypothetical protein
MSNRTFFKGEGEQGDVQKLKTMVKHQRLKARTRRSVWHYSQRTALTFRKKGEGSILGSS